jgi:hypothetical protein
MAFKVIRNSKLDITNLCIVFTRDGFGRFAALQIGVVAVMEAV